MNFLLENERAYLGASTLLEKLGKVGINPALYELPSPFIFKPDEVLYWTGSMLNELADKPLGEETQYIRKVCGALRKWAHRNYVVHVL